jgi:hypothetical protein
VESDQRKEKRQNAKRAMAITLAGLPPDALGSFFKQFTVGAASEMGRLSM